MIFFDLLNHSDRWIFALANLYPMIIKTKKYQLPTGTYIKMGLKSILMQQWWVILIALSICFGYLWIASIWWFIGSLIAYGLYVLFWTIQFAGVTQMEQNKPIFQKMAYEIDSRQILMKINAREGMPIQWNMIKRVEITKDAFVLYLSKAQFIHLPFRIFNTENEKKFLETILKRKELI
ncbi:YcxB-like protein [Algoriphagus alkaliphilus]|uniref:YcxB-like protein n=2 Tax=Algoriphagus alkaliphilus TaxID=279824 RepID=A0A1G5ZQM3_9BACT|nr:YcxB-like protein [Algoriphagus alkaliphilus]